jgi:beta-glucosidase
MGSPEADRRRRVRLSRREFVGTGVAASMSLAAAAGIVPGLSPRRVDAVAASGFPKGFLWGVATAAHQVEGNNINSDLWVLEHLKPSMYPEPSGDACDHYHRYLDDIKLVASLGFNTYRFSIEWARIEPEQGLYSNAELEHYRRMLTACHEQGLMPMVTFWHFTAPRWFAALGGWESDGAGDLFARYCERASKHLGDLIGAAATFNEPNVPILIRWLLANLPQNPFQGAQAMHQQAARAVGSDRFSSFMMGDGEKQRDIMIPAHARAVAAIKSGPGKFPVGLNLAISDDQAVGPDSQREAKRAALYEPWLAVAAKDDFIGVQTYSRSRVGSKGDLPPEPGVELTQMGYEFWPEALEQTIRYAAERTRVPVYVTENGIGTDDDTRRVEYIRRALAGVQNCVNDRIDVRGYVYWSFLDNFEWIFGYRPKFGIVAVNRETQERTIKPSAHVLGDIAKRNAL